LLLLCVVVSSLYRLVPLQTCAVVLRSAVRLGSLDLQSDTFVLAGILLVDCCFVLPCYDRNTLVTLAAKNTVVGSELSIASSTLGDSPCGPWIDFTLLMVLARPCRGWVAVMCSVPEARSLKCRTCLASDDTARAWCHLGSAENGSGHCESRFGHGFCCNAWARLTSTGIVMASNCVRPIDHCKPNPTQGTRFGTQRLSVMHTCNRYMQFLFCLALVA
jgi:hypothetical protein